MIASKHDESVMLWPKPIWFDNHQHLQQVKGYHLLKDINWPSHGFFHLHSQCHDLIRHKLPDGFRYYVLSWHGEYIHHEWLEAQNIDAPIILLHDWNNYQPNRLPKNVYAVRWIYWHHIFEKMMQWFGVEYTKDIKYKVSAFCNRITQSKLWITTAILKQYHPADRLIGLSDWLEEKNVHHWQKTGNPTLDDLQEEFRIHWLGKKISIDEFGPEQNYQIFTANPAHPAYQQAALHFTNESWHYSLMFENNKEFIYSGPNFSEKTLKCLLGATAFIPVGQFDVYRTLSDLGMIFDYGFDLSFDQDPGNITRATKIIALLQNLDRYSADELFQMTRQSSLHNQELIVSRDFYKVCENHNVQNICHLQKLLDHV